MVSKGEGSVRSQRRRPSQGEWRGCDGVERERECKAEPGRGWHASKIVIQVLSRTGRKKIFPN